MNAERLHAYAQAILTDFQETKSINHVKQLLDSLQNQVNSPQQAQHQQAVSKVLETLTGALSASLTSEFSPAWRQIQEETGSKDLLGLSLLSRIQAVFQRNQITPSVALEEIKQIFDQLSALHGAVKQLCLGLGHFRIGSEDLETGECEFAMLIPRTAVQNKLYQFGTELRNLNKTIAVFSELAAGQRSGFEIRTISSSDLSVFLDIAPEVGAYLAVAIERIVALYKSLLEIRLHRSALAEQGLSDDDLESVDKKANEKMSTGIEDVASELLEKCDSNLDQGRSNELRTEIKFSLNQIATRIDRGYHLEVRIGAPNETPDPDDAKCDEKLLEAINTITVATKRQGFLGLSGEPILNLPQNAGLEELNDGDA